MTSPLTVTRAAADIGGTFTDVAVLTPDGRLATRKLPSTPRNYADAVIAAVRSLLEELGSPLDALEELLHGCTVATNAILEGKARRPRCSPRAGFATCWSSGGCGCRTSTSRSTSARRLLCRGSIGSRSTSGPDRAGKCSAPSTKRTCAPPPSASEPPTSRRSRSATCTPTPTLPTSSAPARFCARCFPAPSSRSRWTCCPRSWSTSAPPPPSSTPTSARR